MYHIRRGDPQKLSMISDVKCEIRMLKILRSILLFSFFHNFFFLINVINKHIIPNTFFTILNYRNYMYFSVLGINCTFWALFSKTGTFSSQPLNIRRPNCWIACEHASQERRSIRNMLRLCIFQQIIMKIFSFLHECYFLNTGE